jgi:aminomethyltransferase
MIFATRRAAWHGTRLSPDGALAAARPRLLEPGLRRLEPGIEHYRVRGGGSTTFLLEPGDRLTIRDLEGRQACELVLFGGDGRPDPAALDAKADAKADGPAEGLLAILARPDEDAAAVLAALRRRGIDPAKAQALRLFGGESLPGAEARFTAQRAATCIIAAPGAPMRVDQQNPPTDLLAILRRATVKPPEARALLPEPLADPRLDLHIDAATAIAYEVKAGEFIQIIDVAGRQCSDFQALTAAQLQRGIERPLDATTTRSLMGAIYPGPGLFSKFFDVDQRPLVEVVRDTVGRHDTFGLACTAKYYEDVGYPGHVNCSENISNALLPYGVAPRKGWEAINFFFNTGVDANNQIHMDEPWSRPGDYVLLRALTDLVCSSSACPDDIDAANGWDPTDIHVRVYPDSNSFSRAVAFRMTPDADPQLTRETGFHPRTAQRTRQFAEYKGFWLPSGFTGQGAIEEYWACREKAVAIDLSALRKFEVLGPDAETLMNLTLTRNVRKLSVGQVVYAALCYEHGGMIDDGTLFRLGQDNFRWIGGSDYGGIWLREQAEARGLRVWVKSSTDQLANLSVQGPKSRGILREIVWTPPAQPSMDELQWFRFAVGRIGDFDGIPIVVSRTGYTGELGYELWCHPKDAPAVWDAVFRAGEPHGMLPCGLAALDMLRIEAGLVFADTEFCDQTNPFEAGIGFAVALKTKNEDFIGKAALERDKAHPQRRLVGLELEGNEPAAHGDCVHIGRGQVGVVTSATRSPILKKNIALARLNVEYMAPGTAVEVGKLDGHQKRIPATVVPFPFYDPEKTRVRA